MQSFLVGKQQKHELQKALGKRMENFNFTQFLLQLPQTQSSRKPRIDHLTLRPVDRTQMSSPGLLTEHLHVLPVSHP